MGFKKRVMVALSSPSGRVEMGKGVEEGMWRKSSFQPQNKGAGAGSVTTRPLRASPLHGDSGTARPQLGAARKKKHQTLPGARVLSF